MKLISHLSLYFRFCERFFLPLSLRSKKAAKGFIYNHLTRQRGLLFYQGACNALLVLL